MTFLRQSVTTKRSILFLIFACAFALTGCAHAQPVVLRGPIVGAVTDHSARVTLQVAARGSIGVEASPIADFSAGLVRSSIVTISDSSAHFVTLELAGLSASHVYYLRPVVDGKPQSFATTRSFRTFPTTGVDTAFTFAFGSCQTQDSYKHSGVWKLMRDLQPLLFLQIGDWTYPDRALNHAFASSDELQEQAYGNKYDPTHPVDSLLATCAVDYVYDDHDFAGDNSDGTNPARTKSIAAYSSYFPHYDLPNDTDGVWHTFMAGNVQFFMLDLRSVRSPSAEAVVQTNGQYQFAPPAGHSMLRGLHKGGVDQLTWLENALKTSPARWKVVLSSVTWNPGMKNFRDLGVLYANLKHDPSKLVAAVDSWVGYPEDQDTLLAFIQREGIKNVLFCSGDVHTGMMDDGEHSVFPEIVAANLEIQNSDLYGQLDSLGIAKNLWDRGGQVHDAANCYGRITIRTTPVHLLTMEVVNERNEVVSRYVMPDANGSARVHTVEGDYSAGVKILDQRNDKIVVQFAFEHGPVKFYLADETGKVLKVFTEGDIAPGALKFNLSTASYANGTYFFVLETEGAKWQRKFTITH